MVEKPVSEGDESSPKGENWPMASGLIPFYQAPDKQIGFANHS